MRWGPALQREPDPDFLKPESLEWARKHIEQYGDSDMLPRLFEYDAIKFGWQTLQPLLAQMDIARFESRAFHTFLLPKEKGGYRVALRLDPIDSILYTAAVYEASQLIEQARMPRDRSIACAYRIEIGPEGRLFPQDNGWGLFAARSRVWGEKNPDGYVVSTDIADFYNHINIHKIGNALETAGVPTARADAIQRMLLSWTTKQSRGIPAGPQVSNVLAEICLNDVDQKLLSEGLAHSRYADDFRIFCSSKDDAQKALHTLAEHLFKTQGLSLAGHKTSITLASEFAKINDDPLLVERRRKQTIVRKAAEDARLRRETEAREAALRREIEAALQSQDDPLTEAQAEAAAELDRWLNDWLDTGTYPPEDVVVVDLDDDSEVDVNASPPTHAIALSGVAARPAVGSIIVTADAPPDSTTATLSDDEQSKLALIELFRDDLAADVVGLSRMRHHFRRAGLLDVDSLHEMTLPNLGGKLLPVLRDAIIYLQRTTKKADRERVAKVLLSLTEEPHLRFLPWAQEWLLTALTTSFSDCDKAGIERAAVRAREHDQIGRRALALVARAQKNHVWVREFVRSWNSIPIWDKRALIAAGSILTSGEQNAWKKQIEAGDILDRAVAEWALRQPPPPAVKAVKVVHPAAAAAAAKAAAAAPAQPSAPATPKAANKPATPKAAK